MTKNIVGLGLGGGVMTCMARIASFGMEISTHNSRC